MHTAYIGLGTNIEPRLERMQQGIQSLQAFGNMRRCSSIFETAPLGFADQSEFLNAVVALETGLAATDLHSKLKQLEIELGRQHRERWHEREIDLDLLFFDTDIITSRSLTIPHPELQNRAFVLVPLVEIAPMLVHPVFNKTIKDLLDDLEETDSSVHVYS